MNLFNRLKVFKILSAPERVASLDFFRAIAILSVVLFHFNGTLPYGYLGVDLFFVISGTLIGGVLIKRIKSNVRISLVRFILQRGLKIWPSYYGFLLGGSILSYFFISELHPDELIHGKDLIRYLFFYQNYTGIPFHWGFDHVWSICVEEHFYILLPI